MVRYISASLTIVILLIASPIFAIASAPTPESVHKPKITDQHGNSLNWAGYAVDASVGTVTDVKGSWIVPAVNCAVTPNSYSSFWIGIDGDINSNTVEQTGTDSDCNPGKHPSYYAWYEFYPAGTQRINSITVHPGDVMSAEVSYDGATNTFTTTITDTTTGQTFTSPATAVSNAQRNSAEWIAEAPSSISRILPLADFGIAKYGVDYTTIGSTNYATISGTTGNISSLSSVGTINQITMVDSVGNTKAYPSNLSSDGTSFNVTWVSSNWHGKK